MGPTLASSAPSLAAAELAEVVVAVGGAVDVAKPEPGVVGGWLPSTVAIEVTVVSDSVMAVLVSVGVVIIGVPDSVVTETVSDSVSMLNWELAVSCLSHSETVGNLFGVLAWSAGCSDSPSLRCRRQTDPRLGQIRRR